MYHQEEEFLKKFWTALEGDSAFLNRVTFEDIPGGLPSRFQVSALASASVACATLAAADLSTFRMGGSDPKNIHVNCIHAGASFLSDRLAEPIGWKLEEDDQDFTGNYPTLDGWIRLHVGYEHHRVAARAVLKTGCDRKEVSAAVLRWRKDELESQILAAGGCAAQLRTEEEWSKTPHALALKQEPIFAFRGTRAVVPRFRMNQDSAKPLSGLKVLDLTRVLAGPIGSRFLAAYGAEVLRIDPPNFYESNGLLVETTRGKETAYLDLKAQEGRKNFEELLRNADVLIHGYRPGAMENLGYDAQKISELNSALLIVRHNAYGWTGPWRDRRGFDSLVQMSTGIASPMNGSRPEPLPAQALDYATGYLIAAAACRGLIMKSQEIRLSLAKTTECLISAGKNSRKESKELDGLDRFMGRFESQWGPVKQLTCPGSIDRWTSPAIGLGRINSSTLRFSSGAFAPE
jgi:hypothetical protein